MVEALSESMLLARLRAGDAAAYESLVRTYGGRLLAIARRMVGDEDDAQDVLQEAFISAFKAIDRFEGQSRLYTWLHRILINAALMKLRTRRRRHEQPIEALLPAFLDDGHAARPAAEWRDAAGKPLSDAESLLSRSETRAFVRDSIERLPESYQVVLKLRDIEELDTDQTAEILGIEPNAVKVRLHRARQALRTLLDERFGGRIP